MLLSGSSELSLADIFITSLWIPQEAGTTALRMENHSTTFLKKTRFF
jgi:hypothetical protein